MKLGQLTDVGRRNIFMKNFACFGGLGPHSSHFLIQKRTTINQKPIMMNVWCFNLFRMHTEIFKNNNQKRAYTDILSKLQKGLELVSSLHNKTKNELEMFGKTVLIPGQIYLILTRILKKQLKV